MIKVIRETQNASYSPRDGNAEKASEKMYMLSAKIDFRGWATRYSGFVENENRDVQRFKLSEDQ